MDVNPDYYDLLSAFNDERVRYLLVGAYAVAYHTEPRYTKDLDVWVEPRLQNAERVWRALKRFGAPLLKIEVAEFADSSTVYRIGKEPNRIDIASSISGVSFDRAWRNRARTTYGGLPLSVIGGFDLIRNKQAVGRPQDM